MGKPINDNQFKSHFPTPDWSHFAACTELAQHVYEPSDDTFLLLDALEIEFDFLRHLRPKQCIEIGSGSGCVITFLANMLRNQCISHYLAVDINVKACLATKMTAAQNHVDIDVICADLLAPLEKRLANQVDVVIFNPPYVPTPADELGQRDIVASWAGGQLGTVILNRIMPMLQVRAESDNHSGSQENGIRIMANAMVNSRI